MKPAPEFIYRPELKWESCKLLSVGHQYILQNLDQLYILVSSAHKTTRHDMTLKRDIIDIILLTVCPFVCSAGLQKNSEESM